MSQPNANALMQRTLWHTQETSWLESSHLKATANAVEPAASADQLLIEASASLISLGTERTVITHRLPAGTANRMRVPYMQGQFSEPFTYGYSLVGTVIEGPDGWLHKRVHLLHPHQHFALVETADVTPLPDQLSDTNATLISNMETAVNALWDAQPSIGDRIVVIGYGLIGTLIAELLREIPGIDLTIAEPQPWRREKASQEGHATSKTIPQGKNADLVINTATSDQALQAAIECARFEGTIVHLSWHGSNASTIKLGGSFHFDRKRLISSQVSHIPSSRVGRWNHTNRKELVINLLLGRQNRLNVDKSIAFKNTPAFFNSLRQQSLPERSVVIRYQD